MKQDNKLKRTILERVYVVTEIYSKNEYIEDFNISFNLVICL
jgi:hypothetical protein